MFGLLSPLGLIVICLYLYVTAAIVRAECKSEAGFSLLAIVKAITWPATIWHSIEKLYRVQPRVE